MGESNITLGDCVRLHASGLKFPSLFAVINLHKEMPLTCKLQLKIWGRQSATSGFIGAIKLKRVTNARNHAHIKLEILNDSTVLDRVIAMPPSQTSQKDHKTVNVRFHKCFQPFLSRQNSWKEMRFEHHLRSMMSQMVSISIH